MRNALALALAPMLLAAPLVSPMSARAQDAQANQNAQKARTVLNEMVQALGGQAWLNIQNVEEEGQVAAFFHGNPDPGTTLIYDYRNWPDHERIDVTKHRDYVQFFIGPQAWEVTYRGKRPIPQEQSDDYFRRRDHSIETAVKVWLKDPQTILIDEGQKMAARHLAEQVTLISASNDSITILVDEQTHLPLQRIFQWRDPVYHDKNTETEEYDDYHTVQGFPSPFTISRTKNGDTVREFYVTKVIYNQNLPSDFWDADASAKRIKK
jgi:hypothetical protein